MRDKSGKEEGEKEGAARVGPAMRGRRCSRHVLSRSFSETSTSSYESALMGEAHGIVTDMLADGNLPPHIISGLEALSNLLRPPDARRPVLRTRVSAVPSLLEGSCGSYSEESPFIGERPSALAEKLHHGLHPSLLRRVTSSTWTTTTSATGMPTLEPEPCRRRTSSLKLSREGQIRPSSSQGCASSAASPHPSSQLKGPVSKSRSFSVSPSQACERRAFRKNLEGEKERGECEDPASRNGLMSQKVSQAVPPGTAHKSSSGDPGSLQPKEDRTTEVWETKRNTMKDLQEETLAQPEVHKAKAEDANVSSPVFTVQDVDSSPFLEISRLNEWDFPIFDFAAQEKFVLSKVAYKLFAEVNLMDTFRIPETEFINYFHFLELGYRENPYHNRVHATDVLHGVYYLTTRPVPGLASAIVADTGSSRTTSADNGGKKTAEGTLHHRPSFRADDTYGIMGGNLTALELLALYTAAAIHDYDHPGRTNAFLVATQAPQAILYNDRAVLENHHIASAWSLLVHNQHHNFLTGLEPAEFKRFRFLVIEMVLATDLKRHFEILAEFNAKVNDEEGSGVDWTVETDRLLVLQAVIKLADISGPLKPLPLHLQWTARIAEEFYQQGDEEASLGLPVSPYMDRHHPQLAKLQETFINHLVAPLCNAMATGGLLPGVWVDDTETEDEKAPARPAKEERRTRSWQVHCPLSQNLRDNLDHWAGQVKEDLAAAVAAQGTSAVRADAADPSGPGQTARSSVSLKSSTSTEETTKVEPIKQESGESR